MEEIFKQYAAPIIIAIVIVALIAIISYLLGADDTSPVKAGFLDMVNNFMGKADLTTPTPAP